MEFLNQFGTWILGIIGGLSLTTILSAIIYGCLKGAFSKAIGKINVQKIADQATEKGIEKVKKVSFTHTIQPIVESELKKINEEYVATLRETLEDVSKKYDNLIEILKNLSAYFDNSIGVPETAKAELKKALLKAENKAVEVESVVVEENIVETPKQAVDPKIQAKTPTKVER